MGVPKFLKLGFPQLWGPITLCEDLWLRWGLKKSCSPHQELSNFMWHMTYMQGNRGNSRLLIVIGSPSFGHNLCFKCPNGSCEPILDIYVLKAYQWYKEFLNSNRFWPLRSLSKNSEVHQNSNSQSGSSLGSVRVPSLTFFYTPRNMRCDSWTSLLAHPCKPLPWSQAKG